MTFKIRVEQMRALEAAALAAFLQTTAESVRKRLPGCCTHLPEPALLALLQEGMAQAEGYGITDREELAGFLDLVVAHGTGFGELDSFGWAEPILSDKTISGDVKMATLLERMPKALRPETVCGVSKMSEEKT